MNPYQTFVSQIAQVVREGRNLPLGGFASPSPAAIPATAPRVLIFSPHPDDEVIIGGLALRLQRELGWRAVNVAVTLGSNPARQAARWEELQRCCHHIGFELIASVPGGLERVKIDVRENHPDEWDRKVDCIQAILRQQKPQAILFPHDDDWNGTHLGTHHLVVDALRSVGTDFTTLIVETEFWGAMDTPNLLVECSERDLSDLVAALSFHVGEVQRNPYHLRLAAWMIDNVRRGSELVGGQGGAAPDQLFGTLYRLRRWANGGFRPVLERGTFIGQGDSLADLFRP